MTIDLPVTLGIIGGLITIVSGFATLIWKFSELKHRLLNHIKEVDRRHDEANTQEKLARQDQRTELLAAIGELRRQTDKLANQIDETRENFGNRFLAKCREEEFALAEIKAHLRDVEGFMQKTGDYTPRNYLEPGDTLGWKKP